MTLPVIQIAVLLVTFISCHVEGKRDPITNCAACRALVDELQYVIRNVDPSKTIDVGSFRINSDGKQVQKKVALAKSEVYISEVLESICEQMDDYSLYYDPKTKEKSFKRFAPRDNEDLPSADFSNFEFTPGGDYNPLKYACHRVVEENEEEIVSLVTQEASNFAYKLCTEIAGFCKEIPHSEL